MAKITDVTQEYMDNARPKNGKLIYEQGYNQKIHQDEIAMGTWLHAVFGGNVILLKENTQYYGVKTPDFLWNDAFWEMKRLSTNNQNTINGRIRKAFEQIDSNRGGVIIDITNSKLTMEQAKHNITKSALRRVRGVTDVIIKKGQSYSIFRIKKE